MMVATAEMAKILTLSSRQVQSLEKQGVLQKGGRGTWSVPETVAAYVAHREAAVVAAVERQASAPQNRFADARAKAIELRNAVAERNLISLDEAIQAVDFIAGWVVSAAQMLAGQITDDLAMRERIDDGVDAMLNRLSDRALAAGVALQSGDDPFSAPATRRASR